MLIETDRLVLRRWNDQDVPGIRLALETRTPETAGLLGVYELQDRDHTVRYGRA